MTTNRSKHQAKRMRATIARTQPACHICGQPIDYTITWPDPRCFVVDHVIPIHKGGKDTLNNAAAAHNDCNSKKRARLIAPIVRRSGALD